jgi:hypothetical protein
MEARTMATRKATTSAAAELQSAIADGAKSPSAMAAEQKQEKEAKALPAKAPAKELPAATWDKGEYMLPQFKPTVTGPDGAEHKCGHFWGHSTEKAARSCAGHLASAAGLSL